ncbi:hypothetical protein QYF36_007743 [Acer negundo]|nr:hypothetical protein QYF36_007743 [Acer negundo]
MAGHLFLSVVFFFTNPGDHHNEAQADVDDEVDLNVKDGAQNDHNRAQTDVDDEADLNVKGGAQADAEDNGSDEDNGHDVVGDGSDFVDPNMDWDSLEFQDVPCAECVSGFDIDDRSDDLNSLDGSDGKDDE